MSNNNIQNDFEYATLGGGCFWCTEAVFIRLKGVIESYPGYSGGKIPNPTYEQVSTSLTGHVEVVHIKFDPKLLSYRSILEIFFSTHDPTTLNQQGADIGTQYRSVIFYHSKEQKMIAKTVIQELTHKNVYQLPIVTAVEPFSAFYPAEEYHQKYYEKNKLQPYSIFVIKPKVEKLEKVFKEKMKK
jgi:peptide-methionine (S)-S-oxide reductase